MSILLIDGFDMYNGNGANTGARSKWRSSSGVDFMSMQTGRFNGQSMSCPNGSNFSPKPYYLRDLGATYTSVGIGFAFRVWTDATLSADATALYPFLTTALGSDTAGQVGLSVTPSGQLQAVRLTGGMNAAGTLLGAATAAGVIQDQTWHYIEFAATINGSTGTVLVKVDGVTQLNLTAQNTQQQASAGADRFAFASNLTNTTGANSLAYDDLYVTDGSTLGERRVETLRPASDSAVVWTPNTGVTNFSRVNETLVDGDTSYVQASTLGDRDLYALGSLSTPPTTIDAVQVVSFAEKTDANARAIYNSVKSSGTDSDGASFALAASYGRFDRLLLTDPNGGGAWTAARVNGLLLGPKVA